MKKIFFKIVTFFNIKINYSNYYENAVINYKDEKELEKIISKQLKDIKVIFIIFNAKELSDQLEKFIKSVSSEILIVPIGILEEVNSRKEFKIINENLKNKLNYYFLLENKNIIEIEKIIEGVEGILEEKMLLSISLEELKDLIFNNGKIIFKSSSAKDKNRVYYAVRNLIEKDTLINNLEDCCKAIVLIESNDISLIEASIIIEEIRNFFKETVVEIEFGLNENVRFEDELKVKIYATTCDKRKKIKNVLKKIKFYFEKRKNNILDLIKVLIYLIKLLMKKY